MLTGKIEQEGRSSVIAVCAFEVVYQEIPADNGFLLGREVGDDVHFFFVLKVLVGFFLPDTEYPEVFPAERRQQEEIYHLFLVLREFAFRRINVQNLFLSPYHILFMPCSDEFKYARRFKRLDWYITTHRPDLSSGLYDVDVFESRDSLHEAKGGENRILERNYRITGNIEGKQIIIVDDVLTSGQSMADYKEEIERCGGKVVAAIFYGKTVTRPPLLLIKAHVWGGCIVNKIKELTK